MLENRYSSPNILNFLDGRDYLLAEKYFWINNQSQEVPIDLMEVEYQLNCMDWLVLSLDTLKKETTEVKAEIKPLFINKMEQFKEIFSTVVTKETAQLRISYEKRYKKLEKNFKEKIRKV